MEIVQPGGGPNWANPSGPNRNVSSPMEQQSIDNDPQSILLQPFSTLDEPIKETIMRDVRAVGSKLMVVLKPLDKSVNLFGYIGIQSSEEDSASQEDQPLGDNQRMVIDQLRDWDLWGPLVITLLLSVVLALKAPANQAKDVFAAVFIAVWLGSSFVTFNARLLGSKISFFQSVCVLGYCVFPLVLSALVVGLLRLTPIWNWLDMIWIGVGFIWATRASSVFFGMYIQPKRRALAVFPVLFYYTFLSWLILLF